ncbi:MAG: tetratricopeptide repeat protein, partial [Anaerolineae bacterium]|nr:tetratricopeptide repeat protein [Anaerolineae bacterium]
MNQLSKLADQLDNTQPTAGMSRLADITLRRAALAELTGDYDQVIKNSRSAIELAHEAGDLETESRGYLSWGQALWRTGDYGTAHQTLQSALDYARRAGT